MISHSVIWMFEYELDLTVTTDITEQCSEIVILFFFVEKPGLSTFEIVYFTKINTYKNLY